MVGIGMSRSHEAWSVLKCVAQSLSSTKGTLRNWEDVKQGLANKHERPTGKKLAHCASCTTLRQTGTPLIRFAFRVRVCMWASVPVRSDSASRSVSSLSAVHKRRRRLRARRDPACSQRLSRSCSRWSNFCESAGQLTLPWFCCRRTYWSVVLCACSVCATMPREFS